jgi:hypothetical protein
MALSLVFMVAFMFLFLTIWADFTEIHSLSHVGPQFDCLISREASCSPTASVCLSKPTAFCNLLIGAANQPRSTYGSKRQFTAAYIPVSFIGVLMNFASAANFSGRPI